MKYTIKALESGIYKIKFYVSAPASGGLILLSLDGQSLNPALNVPSTGGWQNWQPISTDSIYLSAGNHTLQTRFIFGGFNFSYMDFELLVTGVEEKNNKPLSYKLHQNYPNPFNPFTTIKFSIPKSSNVEIKVYDVLGNEMVVLVDEYKESGNYSIDFNAESLASGIYYYVIKSNNFYDTKKMVLIK
jgi:hypothetical protein